MSNQVTIGVDVGTGSVRAGVFTLSGKMLGTASASIKENHPKEDFYEQSSRDIWKQSGVVVRKALAESGRTAQDVIGLSYDATCSLVALDAKQGPVTVSESGDDDWNIIVWRDHRAIDQVTRITGHVNDILVANRGKIDTTFSNVSAVTAELPQVLAGVRTVLVDIRTITGKLKEGEGTVARLIGDDELHLRIQRLIDDTDSLIRHLKENGVRIRLF